jgi:FkbM family methyltransferase
LKADLQGIFRQEKLPVRIKIIDAGAAQFEDHHNRLVALAEQFGGEVFCFEPNAEQYSRLKTRVREFPGVHVLPLALGDGGEHELKICRHPGGTSLLEPNPDVAGRYQAFGEWLEVIERVKLKTVELDQVDEIRNAEFLKLDIQGAELSALKCATQLLSTLLVVECEVNFVQQYIDQPLFSEIELFLRLWQPAAQARFS